MKPQNRLLQAFMVLVSAYMLVGVASPVPAQETRTVTVVFNELTTQSTKTISIPEGYGAVSAKITIVLADTQKTTVRVVVGREHLDLAWPTDTSATLDLAHEATSYIPVSVLATTTGSCSINIEIICERIGQS